MSHTLLIRRGRSLAAVSATLGLCLGAAALVSAPAQSAEPAGDCTAPFPVADLQPGDEVTGLTVESGTTPQPFTGDVLGVLDDGIAPDVDMIMVELSSPRIDAVGGIWQGMSGSPVYASDGRLIGAVAYGLSWGPTPIAGVTPFADMDNYLEAPAGKVAVGPAAARAIASNTAVTQDQAAQGFAPLRMPTGVSGVGATRLAQSPRTPEHKWLPKDTYAMGASSASANAATPDTIVAGGNLAASLSYGDITQAGVGTATSVCNGRVVGFGHPMTFLGETTLTMHPANALYIQPESLGAPFKVANLGAPAGTITDDHRTGITGLFGGLPETMGISSTVTYRERNRTGTSHVSVPEAAASTTFYQSIANHDGVLDGIVQGSELQSWTITGHQANGTPFSLAVTDRYVSNYDITFEAAWELADFVWSLSSIEGVTIDDVSMSSAVNDDNSTWKVSRLEQKVHGQWVQVGKGAPVFARAGRQLAMRAVLTGASGSRVAPITLALPARSAGSMGRMMVLGGSELWSNLAYPRSLGQAEKYVDTLVRNDQVQAVLQMFEGRGGNEQTNTSAPQDKVVYGHKGVRVFIR